MNTNFLYKGQMKLIVLVAPIEVVINNLEKIDWYQYNDYSIFERYRITPNNNLFDIIDIEYKTYNNENPEINIIWEPFTASGYTIIRTFMPDGRYTLTHCLAKKGIECYCFYIDNEVFPAYFFYRISSNKDNERYVHYITEDNKNVFFQKGNLLSFEKPEYYKRKKKKDRLNPEIIIEYMNALGCNILDDKFWISSKDAYKDVRTFIHE